MSRSCCSGLHVRRLGSRSRSTSASIDRLLPELRPLVGCEQEPEWHPEGDVWIHTLMVIDKARALNGDLDRPRLTTVMLGAVCHDLGKPATTAVIDGRIRSIDHEQAGVEPTLSLLDRLNVHSIDGFDVRVQVVGLVANHLKPGMFHKAPNVGDGAFRRLAQKVDLELLARLARADCLGRTGTFDCSAMDWFLERARALGVEHQPPAPLLLGRHVLELGLSPGPQVGEILRQVYEKQLDGEIRTVEEAIDAARTLYCTRNAKFKMQSKRSGRRDSELVSRRVNTVCILHFESCITALCTSRTPLDRHSRPTRSRRSLPVRSIPRQRTRHGRGAARLRHEVGFAEQPSNRRPDLIVASRS